MPYIKLYFGKESTELTYEDIESYFKEEKEESDKIEFKSYTEEYGKNDKEKETGILRTICGLLNSEGGIIIWGAPKGKPSDTDPKRKIFIGELSPATKLIDKDSFINRVTDSITPSPRAVNFYPLKKDNSYVFIIDVEKSNYSPHQFRSIYYMRLDGQTVHAPHHYIEALFKKITFPKLEGYIKINSATASVREQKYTFVITIYLMNTSKFQNELDLVCRVIIVPGIFSYSQIPPASDYANSSELNLQPAKRILFTGEVFERVETITIPFNNMESRELHCHIVLFFGGKTSPLIMSNYLVMLKSIPGQGSNYNSMLKVVQENKYAHEISEDLGLKHQDTLMKLLGR